MFPTIQEIEHFGISSHEEAEQKQKENYKKDVFAEAKRVINNAVLRKETYCVLSMVTSYHVYYPDVWQDLVKELNSTNDYFCAASGFKEGKDICYNQFTHSSDVIVVLFRKNGKPLTSNVLFPLFLIIATPIVWFILLLEFLSICKNPYVLNEGIIIILFVYFIGTCTITHYAIYNYFWQYVPIRNALRDCHLELKKN